MKRTGKPTDALAELLDLFPTLVDLCGLPMPNGLEGKSLAPVLSDPGASVKEAAFTQHPRPAYYQEEPDVMGVSMRTDQDRYTEWRDFKTGGVVARELYDHHQGPHETRNVVNEDKSVSVLGNLQAALAKTFPERPHIRR